MVRYSTDQSEFAAMVFSIVGLLLGACIGLRFKALALVPVILAGMALLAMLSFMPSFAISGRIFVVAVLALNAGYLAASIFRFAFFPAIRLRGLAPSPALSEHAR